MQNFTTMIVDMMREEKLFAPQGGPIIIAQVINLCVFSKEIIYFEACRQL